MSAAMTSDASLRSLKRLVRTAIEALWRTLFSLTGHVVGRSVTRWSSSGGERILVVAPHPDDETIGCGGTLLAHVAAGDEVRILFITDGRASRALGLPPDEMARRREAEARAAIEALGLAGMTWLGLREGEWRLEEAKSRIGEVLTAFRPGIVYVPSRIDFHPEHVRSAFALGAVVQNTLPSSARIRVYPVQVPLTSILVNLVHVGILETDLSRATSAYPSQADTLVPSLRMGRHAAAFHGARNRAEEFWELSPRAYAAVHAGEPSITPETNFRGIRREPWVDPLSFLVGRRARSLANKLASSEPSGP